MSRKVVLSRYFGGRPPGPWRRSGGFLDGNHLVLHAARGALHSCVVRTSHCVGSATIQREQGPEQALFEAQEWASSTLVRPPHQEGRRRRAGRKELRPTRTVAATTRCKCVHGAGVHLHGAPRALRPRRRAHPYQAALFWPCSHSVVQAWSDPRLAFVAEPRRGPFSRARASVLPRRAGSPHTRVAPARIVAAGTAGASRAATLRHAGAFVRSRSKPGSTVAATHSASRPATRSARSSTSCEPVGGIKPCHVVHAHHCCQAVPAVGREPSRRNGTTNCHYHLFFRKWRRQIELACFLPRVITRMYTCATWGAHAIITYVCRARRLANGPWWGDSVVAHGWLRGRAYASVAFRRAGTRAHETLHLCLDQFGALFASRNRNGRNQVGQIVVVKAATLGCDFCACDFVG